MLMRRDTPSGTFGGEPYQDHTPAAAPAADPAETFAYPAGARPLGSQGYVNIPGHPDHGRAVRVKDARPLADGSPGCYYVVDVLRPAWAPAGTLRLLEVEFATCPPPDESAPPPVVVPHMRTPTAEVNGKAARMVAAKAAGFTGNFCQSCGSEKMVRSGACEKCDACGATSGCS